MIAPKEKLQKNMSQRTFVIFFHRLPQIIMGFEISKKAKVKDFLIFTF
jgi:hypothetical protein